MKNKQIVCEDFGDLETTPPFTNINNYISPKLRPETYKGLYLEKIFWVAALFRALK